MSFENETFEGADSAEPTAQVDRTALATLKRLENDPIQQYVRYEKYVKSLAVRAAKLRAALSPATVELIQRTKPELLK